MKQLIVEMQDLELYYVTNFYRFFTVAEERLGDAKKALEQRARELSLGGLIILAAEGN